MPTIKPTATEPTCRLHVRQGCGCSPRGCLLTLCFLYFLQCLLALGAQWHKYDTHTINGVKLTLHYPTHECVTMYTPILGTLPLMIHWATWGNDLELVKELDIRLRDGRTYTLQSENYQRLEQLGIRQTPEGIQLTDAQGQNYVDTPLIPYSAFQK